MEKKKIKNKITVVLISYKSEKKILDFVKNIPKHIKTIVIENSNNQNLKKKIEKKYNNIFVYIRKNQGISSSLNYAVKKIKTEYFLQISPDIKFNFKNLNYFYNEAKNLNNKFSALGPRFLNVSPKGHKQIDPKLRIGSIKAIHGSCMFINKKKYKEIGGFDEKFFLYWEEIDYCKKGLNKNLKSYQINKIKVKTQGRTVITNDTTEKRKLSNLLIWHFIWSKFYYHKKHEGFMITLICFIPLLIRTIFKILLNKFLKNEIQLQKYKYRFNGLVSSIKGVESYMRL